uniref:Uncharacterized protein n=1 Tax=Rhizophora mucronata TaxID=61149 RepID=A0A2P2QJ47_RHIMU
MYCHLVKIHSPIITTGTNSILKVVESTDVPHNNFSTHKLRYQFCYSVAIPTYSNVFNYSYYGSWTCVNESTGNGQSLTVIPKHLLL